ILSFYVSGPVEQAAPLLPNMLGMAYYAALLVTLFVALPLWFGLNHVAKPRLLWGSVIGGVLGVVGGATAHYSTVPEWPSGLLLWSGAVGGATAGCLFHLITSGAASLQSRRSVQ